MLDFGSELLSDDHGLHLPGFDAELDRADPRLPSPGAATAFQKQTATAFQQRPVTGFQPRPTVPAQLPPESAFLARPKLGSR